MDSPTRRVELHDDRPIFRQIFRPSELPRWGLTVGLKALLKLEEVRLLAKGSAKARIVHDTLHGETGASNRRRCSDVIPIRWLFLDQAAATSARLNSRSLVVKRLDGSRRAARTAG